MANAGAHLMGINLGLTVLGPTTPGHLERAIRELEGILRAAKKINSDVITLIHGGPFNDPATVAIALQSTGADGYVTGSTAETSPVRAGVADTIRGFKAAASRGQAP